MWRCAAAHLHIQIVMHTHFFNNISFMRKLWVMIFLFICLVGKAQQSRIYFYPDFIPTKITYKNGSAFQVMGNYDVVNLKFMYKQGEQLMELINPQLVDTIFISDSEWTYHNNSFCEVVKRPNGIVYNVAWHITKVNKGYVGAYGTSQVPSKKVEIFDNLGMGDMSLTSGLNNAFSNATQSGGSGLNLDVWKNKNQSTYYFTKDGREYGVKGMKSVLKAFPTKKDQIKQYVHDNHIDTLTAEGMLQVIDYLMTL